MEFFVVYTISPMNHSLNFFSHSSSLQANYLRKLARLARRRVSNSHVFGRRYPLSGSVSHSHAAQTHITPNKIQPQSLSLMKNGTNSALTFINKDSTVALVGRGVRTQLFMYVSIMYVEFCFLFTFLCNFAALTV